MTDERDPAQPQAGKKRLPYEPPAIEETSEFETLALTCGHTANSPSPDCDPYTGDPGS